MRSKIEARDDVKSVRYLNRDDAYTDATTKFPEYKDVASKDSFPASFIVKLNHPGSIPTSTRRCRVSPACSTCSIRRI